MKCHLSSRWPALSLLGRGRRLLRRPPSRAAPALRYQLNGPLIPARMTMVTAWDFPKNPLTDPALDDSKLSKEIRWGYRLFTNTPAEARGSRPAKSPATTAT